MLNVLIWNKYSRVIMQLAERLKVKPLAALRIFYNSELFKYLLDRSYPLITMSDAWIADELADEYQKSNDKKEA
ncbi:MAG: DUF3791 domain-containing protein [Prevotella sp.]|jgi:hypothetical protein|nr:DUF3791 domain-containing protein [Prevotella sp.]